MPKRAPREVFLARLEELGRIDNGLTQKEIARRARISSERITNWKNGHEPINPRLDTITRLGAIAGCGPEWMISDDPAMPLRRRIETILSAIDVLQRDELLELFEQTRKLLKRHADMPDSTRTSGDRTRDTAKRREPSRMSRRPRRN